MNRADFLKALGIAALAPRITAEATPVHTITEISMETAEITVGTVASPGGLTGLLQATSGSSLDGITGGLHDFPVIPMNWRDCGTITGITED